MKRTLRAVAHDPLDEEQCGKHNKGGADYGESRRRSSREEQASYGYAGGDQENGAELHGKLSLAQRRQKTDRGAADPLVYTAAE